MAPTPEVRNPVYCQMWASFQKINAAGETRYRRRKQFALVSDCSASDLRRSRYHHLGPTGSLARQTASRRCYAAVAPSWIPSLLTHHPRSRVSVWENVYGMVRPRSRRRESKHDDGRTTTLAAHIVRREGYCRYMSPVHVVPAGGLRAVPSLALRWPSVIPFSSSRHTRRHTGQGNTSLDPVDCSPHLVSPVVISHRTSTRPSTKLSASFNSSQGSTTVAPSSSCGEQTGSFLTADVCSQSGR